MGFVIAFGGVIGLLIVGFALGEFLVKLFENAAEASRIRARKLDGCH